MAAQSNEHNASNGVNSPSGGAEEADYSNEIYCSCRSNGYGDKEWIGCDYKTCKIEWFHLECVGLTRDEVPEGAWFCDTCKEEMQAQNANPAQVFLCEYCDQEFTDKSECLAHKAEHTEEQRQEFAISPGKKPSRGKKKRSGPHSHKSGPHSHRRAPHSRPTSSDARSVASNEEQYSHVSSPNQRNFPPQNDDNSTTNGKLPGAMSPKTGDTPGQTDPPAGQGAEMGSQPVAQQRVQLSEETLQHLSRFTDEEIFNELHARKEAHVCVCGTVFRDETLYFLHRSMHNTNNPKKCSQCGYVARDWYDFTSHFLVHRKVPSNAAQAFNGNL